MPVTLAVLGALTLVAVAAAAALWPASDPDVVEHAHHGPSNLAIRTWTASGRAGMPTPSSSTTCTKRWPAARPG